MRRSVSNQKRLSGSIPLIGGIVGTDESQSVPTMESKENSVFNNPNDNQVANPNSEQPVSETPISRYNLRPRK